MLVSEARNFIKNLVFWGTRFNGYINFDYTEFGRPFMSFMLVHIAGIARFSSACFKGGANFLDTTFEGNAIFIGSQFHAGASFEKSQFDGDAYFINVRFEGDAKFSNVRFGKYIDFTAAKFQKNLDLNGSNICKMKLHSNFKSDSIISLAASDFNRLDVRWHWIKDHISYDGATYLALVKNFKDLELFEDADDCYYQYRDLSRNLNNKINKNGKIKTKLYDTISLISCGYGVRPGYTLAWILIFIYIFWVIFLGCSGSILESVYFSIASLIGATPDGLPAGAWKYAVVAEGLFGYLFLALFIVVLARKLIR